MTSPLDSPAGPVWRKSSYSTFNGSCVEVAELGGRLIGVRDSEDPAGPVLAFDWGTVWREFTHRVKTGWQPGQP